MTTAIVNAKLIVGDSIVEDKILLYDEKIIGILDDIIMSDSDDLEIIDAKGQYVSAGFIDLHIHGSAGVDVMDATPQALETLSQALLKTGTTGFLATTMTMSEAHIHKALENIQNHATSVSGAKILGVHLEGPFINSEKHGAQDKSYVQNAHFDLIANYIEDIKMITIAPEVAENKTFIQKIAKDYPHIILSIGHSSASYEEAKESFTWGVSHATHLFNAMPSYHHRKPSIVGAVFDSDVTCDVIADLVHTHPSTLNLVHKIKKEKLILITDAMRAGCMKCGTYDLGGREVIVDNGKATLEDGTLAGSVLTMNQALRNMQEHTDMSMIELLHSVTKAPAKKLNILKGELTKGYDADIVIFDEKFTIVWSIICGKILYHT
jgi:N-acetylglucosamine-6-phosphate deacetylase